MTKANSEVGQLLTSLYSSGEEFLAEYPWEFEGDRWAELLVCLLVVELGIETSTARSAIGILRSLGVVSPSNLAEISVGHAAFIERALVQHDFQPDDAIKATKLMASLAGKVEELWQGHIQKFLRTHGLAMAEEFASTLKSLGLPGRNSSKIAVLWLQNVANLPILLPDDPHIRAFCEDHGISDDELVATADDLGLNIAVLDDLLALEAAAGAYAAQATGSAAREALAKKAPAKKKRRT